MRTYTCPSCIRQSSETDQDWDAAIQGGFCPGCQMPLRNFHLHAQAPDQPLSGTGNSSAGPNSGPRVSVEPLWYRYLTWIKAKLTRSA